MAVQKIGEVPKSVWDDPLSTSSGISNVNESNALNAKREKTLAEKLAEEQERERKRLRETSKINPVGINRKDVTDINVDQNAGADMRAKQSTLADQLLLQSQGQGDSVAQQQLKMASENNLAQALAMRAGAGGTNAGLVRRDIERQRGEAGRDLAAQSAMLRLQEQKQSQELLGNVAGSARSQDIQMADMDLKAKLANQGIDLDILKSNAARNDQAAIVNLQTELTKMGYSDDMIKAYMQAQVGLEQARLGYNTAEADRKSAEKEGKRNRDNSMFSGILGAAATVGAAAFMASDINLKKNIKKENGSLGAFLNNLNNYDYDYKDKKWGKGKHTSIMAQDLEKSEIGKSAVINTKEGKIVNYTKLLPAMLSANVDANKRITELEEALKNKNKKDK